jgi:hypothetical protein
MVHKNSIPASQMSHSVSSGEISEAVLLREIVAYRENHYKINTLWQSAWFFNVKICGAYSYQCALNG